MRRATTGRWWALAALVIPASVGSSGASAAEPTVHTTPDGRTVRSFQLYATDGEHLTIDGRSLYIWGYSLSPEPGSATLPGPTIEVNEGDQVEISLTNIGPSRANVHHFPHTIHLHGLDVDQANDGVPKTSPSLAVGQSFTYTFVTRHAGTYWYHCHVDTIEHLTMGMYGALVVHPADGPGRAWTGGPDYDHAYTLLLSEVDPDWADAIGANRTPDRTTFHPRYFFINGRSFPDTMDHDDSHIVGRLGDRVLVRLINAGYQWRSMHMHGFHFAVIATDGRPLPLPYLKDTLSIGPGERYDLLVTLDQLGAYPFHSHVILDNLNDGFYPGGIHTMVTALAADDSAVGGLDGAGHDHHGAAPPAGGAVELQPATPLADPPGLAGASPRSLSAPPPLTPVRTELPLSPPRELLRISHIAEAGEAEVTVVIWGDAFSPERLTISAGTTVHWANFDARTHRLFSRLFDASEINRHEVMSFTYDTPGNYQFECLIHRSMSGWITVVD